MTHSLFTVMPALVVLFWLVFFSLDDQKNKAKRFLILFLAVAFVNYLIHWYYFNNNCNTYYLLDSIWTFTSLSVFPLYYYYIRLLTKDIEVDYRWSWLLLPAFSLALFSAVVYLMMSPQEIEVFTNEILYHNRPRNANYSALIKLQLLRMELFKVIFTVGVILTVFYGLRLIEQFNKKVLANYSDVQHRELFNIKTTLLFLFVAAIVSLISNLLGKDYFIDNSHLLVIPSIAHSVALFGISLAGYKQSFSIRELSKDQSQSINEIHREEEKPVGEDNDTLSGCKYDELYERMEYLLEQEQIFKDADLRLNDLATMLNTNRTYVSRLINNRANTNFCEYINSYRIAYAKKLLSSQDENNLSLEDVVLKSGFSGQSSFYRLFMRMEGMTPAKYKEDLMKGE